MSKKSYSHWYPRYTADYQSKTAHLSMLEHGAYTVLLDHYYTTGKPISTNVDVLKRLCRAFDDTEVDAMMSVLHQFFLVDGDTYRNERADIELIKRGDISEKRRNAVKTRYSNPPTNVGTNVGTNVDTSTSTSTSTSIATSTTPLKPPKGTSGRGYTVDFESWWSEYPNKVGKPVAAKKFKIAIQKASVGELVDGVRRYVRDKPADRAWLNPATFLHQERYNDEPATTDGNLTDSELDRIVLKAAGVEQLATFGGSTPRSDSIGAEGSGNCLEGEFKAR